MGNGSHAGLFKVEIKHRSVIAKRYTWEIHSIGQATLDQWGVLPGEDQDAIH